jgi:hypothetical protein
MTTMVTTAPTATASVTAATAVAAAAIATMAAVTGDRNLVTAQEGNAQDREQDRDTEYKRAIHS